MIPKLHIILALQLLALGCMKNAPTSSNRSEGTDAPGSNKMEVVGGEDFSSSSTQNSLSGWEASSFGIVKITFAGGSICSGTAVDRVSYSDTDGNEMQRYAVITARHCLVDINYILTAVQSVTFYPGSQPSSFSFAPGAYTSYVDTPGIATGDGVGLLALSIAQDNANVFPVASIETSQSTASSSYVVVGSSTNSELIHNIPLSAADWSPLNDSNGNPQTYPFDFNFLGTNNDASPLIGAVGKVSSNAPPVGPSGGFGSLNWTSEYVTSSFSCTQFPFLPDPTGAADFTLSVALSTGDSGGGLFLLSGDKVVRVRAVAFGTNDQARKITLSDSDAWTQVHPYSSNNSAASMQLKNHSDSSFLSQLKNSWAVKDPSNAPNCGDQCGIVYGVDRVNYAFDLCFPTTRSSLMKLGRDGTEDGGFPRLISLSECY